MYGQAFDKKNWPFMFMLYKHVAIMQVNSGISSMHNNTHAEPIIITSRVKNSATTMPHNCTVTYMSKVDSTLPLLFFCLEALNIINTLLLTALVLVKSASLLNCCDVLLDKVELCWLYGSYITFMHVLFNHQNF